MLSRMFKLFGPGARAQAVSPEVLAKLEQARELSEQGHLARAAAICREILALEGNHVDSLMLCAQIAARENNTGQALQIYSRVTEIDPKYAPAHYKRGNALKDGGQLEAAVASYDRAIELDPGHAHAFCNRGAVLEHLNRLDAALASYDRALALDPADALACCNRGTLLRRLGRSSEALASYEKAIASRPDYAEAHFNRAALLGELNRRDEALKSYERVIEIAPRFLHAYISCGTLLREMKRLDAALACYDKAIQTEPHFAEAYKYRGTLLYERKQLDAALESYDKALEIDPGNAEAYYNRGLIFQERKQSDAAMADYDKAIEIVPHFAEAHLNRGALLYAKMRFDEALTCFEKAAELDPSYVEAHLNCGQVLQDLGRWDAALSRLDRAIALAPDCGSAHSQRVLVRMRVCDWRHVGSDIERISTGIAAGMPLPAPLMAVSALLDQPALQHQAAQIWVRSECPPDGRLGAIMPRSRGRKIRVGYYSPDFRWHSVARLTAGLFESHDKSRFEITAFAFGPEADHPIRRRLERAFDRFIDVRDRSDLEVAALSRELEIDVAVDLAGFTKYCRPGIFALRAAPIQLSYIGYLGTMGAPYMDYLVADAAIIPPERQADYSEKIIYLPWYQANDSQREMSPREFTREELGLPAEGFVFCCFNTTYKVQPSTFETWMRILKRVEDSTLFMVLDNANSHMNLLNEAQRRGVPARRLVFGKRLEVDEYLARCRTMDLFLDTWPYNAGTTASDALWAGLPLLTYRGQSFASRCASSLLEAIGLPELIADSPEQYEDLAVDLALNPKRHAAIRQKLAACRNTSPLFDVGAFTGHLESAYERILDRFYAELPPEHLNPR
jgi:protein O-GlcNAc transferase